MRIPQHHPTLAQEVAAVIDWWREAGVDQTFSDDATEWLAEPVAEEPHKTAGKLAKPIEPAAPPPPAKADLFAGTPPADLAAFKTWWLSEPALDLRSLGDRTPPRGETGAKLMVIVADPEQGDTSQLLSQSEGRLLDAMLAAMRLSEAEVYVASVLPRHTPMVDTGALEQEGLGAVLRHHIALVGPQRIIAFGGNILPLIAHDTAQGLVQGSGPSVQFTHQGTSIPVLGVEDLDALLMMPRLKARLWRRWLEWTDS